MKKTILLSVILILTAMVILACGKKGGDEPAAVDTNAPVTVVVTASKALALANGSDEVTILAEVKKADGTAVADGTTVAFSVLAGTGTLSASSASTANGLASVTLACAQISGANNYSLNVTASAGNVSGAKEVKFINQPSSAQVVVAFKQPVANLGGLQFKLNNSAGAAFNNAVQPVAALNSALGSLPAGNFSSSSNSTTIALISASGFNTGTAPIIKATFSIAADAGLPAFGVDPAQASLIVTDPASDAINPAVTADDMVVTVTFDTEL